MAKNLNLFLNYRDTQLKKNGAMTSVKKKKRGGNPGTKASLKLQNLGSELHWLRKEVIKNAHKKIEHVLNIHTLKDRDCQTLCWQI